MKFIYHKDGEKIILDEKDPHIKIQTVQLSDSIELGIDDFGAIYNEILKVKDSYIKEYCAGLDKDIFIKTYEIKRNKVTKDSVWWNIYVEMERYYYENDNGSKDYAIEVEL